MVRWDWTMCSEIKRPFAWVLNTFGRAYDAHKHYSATWLCSTLHLASDMGLHHLTFMGRTSNNTKKLISPVWIVRILWIVLVLLVNNALKNNASCEQCWDEQRILWVGRECNSTQIPKCQLKCMNRKQIWLLCSRPPQDTVNIFQDNGIDTDGCRTVSSKREKMFFTLTSHNFCIWTPNLTLGTTVFTIHPLRTGWDNFQSHPMAKVHVELEGVRYRPPHMEAFGVH